MTDHDQIYGLIAELEKREAAVKDIYSFAEYMEPSGHADFLFKPAAHHRIILDKLQQVGDGEIKRLMIFLPPGAAKSTWGRVFKAWMLARNPHYQLIRVMASQTLAERQARLLRSAIQEPLYKLIAGHELDPNTQALAGFGTTEGGFVLSAGVGTSIVGMRADLGIIDDPVPSWEYIQNADNMEKAYEWYRSEYRTRLKPGAPEILIMTSWHVHDLAGKILSSEEGDTWDVVRLPMEAEDQDDPLGREMGQRLWPEWFTQQMVDQIFSFAELGFQEFETSRYVTGILRDHGFEVEEGVSGMPTAWFAKWGSGKPVIAFGSDIDCIPKASQKPGVAYHDPIIAGAPGHGEGHNSGQAVNVTAALVLQEIMQREKISETLVLWPGVAEEQLGSKAYFVRDGLFKDVDAVIFTHVSNNLSTSLGLGRGSGLVSVEYTFRGEAAHAAVTFTAWPELCPSPWPGAPAMIGS